MFFGTSCFAETPSINMVRTLFQKAPTEENSCKELIRVLGSYNEKNNPLFSGYKACGTMMMAKYVFNPFSKLSYFKKGKNLLEKAILADATNIELRFLRFSVQTNIPSFLGYDDDIENDKKFLILSLSAVKDQTLKAMIISYFKKCGCLTNNENNKIK